ncbi:TetR/AcrR family transcriptional regulator [Paraburkholderia bannensis]|uniref:TetR/AcrR family transcriptional regulator n=1 Tax=Paraburkholderia tropica TaxID=92647 RepID=UPI0009438D0C|nr:MULTISPECIES: TetR/AcrR family transcriptional regulator [Paraburkholderia]QNB13573.1 TetR/AcrR family transcriptional regulator [Paraburkholderia tropica]RQM45005.1 TetR/AcrR family transcriptional regulator [Paraburkholderia bannensis]RQN36845.1 TetR/AcrR family transcriptional regulator [Paraburkholderia tropica]
MRVKTESRRLAYIESAGRLFVDRGFSSVSMDMIAADVGGSKVTLYNYFASKEELFEAFVVEAGRSAVERLIDVPVDGRNIEKTLTKLGLEFLRLITTPNVVALDRLIISEARRLPDLARIFYENGPKRTIEALIRVFDELLANSAIRPVDSTTLALHFKALCESSILERQLWCVERQPNEIRLKKAVASAVSAFLHGYANP